MSDWQPTMELRFIVREIGTNNAPVKLLQQKWVKKSTSRFPIQGAGRHAKEEWRDVPVELSEIARAALSGTGEDE